MQILTVENKLFSLNNLPDEVDDNMRYSILDNSNANDPDFFFPQLILLESFNSPAMVLRIGEHDLTVPLDWCIAVGDSTSSAQIEILPLTSLNDRGFRALAFNPLSSFRVEFKKIEIIDFYNDVKWYFPKLKTGHLLAIPLSNEPEPLCVYIVKDVPRASELIHLDKLL